ncbi:MAG: hypothetical protein RIQ60_3754 [Pseudomonadota bacterium]|jgi:putative spermidine/putrescine transport system ATP-binding protein
MTTLTSARPIAAASTSPSDDTLVRFNAVQKSYDGVNLVVRSLDLSIRRGEFLTLLGPSGSGKTTTLMMLAGFETPTEGEIELNGAPITRTPPHKRNFGMVFQNYALFPHMSVADNVAYPLTVRKLAKDQIAAKVAKALDMVRLGKLGDRRPGQLSGGQQQRVALARALVFEPQLVLMDEPLGALDKQLREHMQIELKELHRQLGVTFVYVTHDQGEALTMSDRVAVFNDGLIQQIAPVTELYETPSNRFVANFVGDSTVLDGAVENAVNGSCELVLDSGVRLAGVNVNGVKSGARAQAAVRPERIEALLQAPAPGTPNIVPANVLDVLYFGDHQRLRCAVAGATASAAPSQATVKLPLATASPAPGQPVWLRIAPEFLRVYA